MSGDHGVQPPQDAIAEQCVLGGMLLSEKAITDATATLTATDFYRPNHGTIFTAITELLAAGEPVDPVTVSDSLQRSGDLERIGGLAYLATLQQAPPVAANAGYYAKIVAGKAKLRQLGELGARLRQLAHSETTNADEVAAAFAEGEQFFRIQNRASTQAMTFDQLVAQWRSVQDKPVSSVPSPWPKLNEWLNGGGHKGELVIIGGRPGDGKSNAGLNWVAFAAQYGYHTVAFSLEMKSLDVTARILAAGAQVKLRTILGHDMDLESSEKVERYISDNKGMSLEVVDQPSITVEQIVAHCRSKKKLDLVFVDYAQLLKPSDSKLERRLQVAHISRSLKVAALEMNILIVAATQLNRGNVKDGEKRAPVVSDIGESGAVEQDADVVLLLNRDPDDDNIVHVIVGKNRNGRKGAIVMPFRGSEARIGL